MFTVKVHGADGVETLYSAETVEVVRNNDHWSDGIYLDREPPSPSAPGDPEPPRCAKHVILFGGQATSDAIKRIGGKVWVMNDSGATVASYDL